MQHTKLQFSTRLKAEAQVRVYDVFITTSGL
jgi:hypothetical protein